MFDNWPICYLSQLNHKSKDPCKPTVSTWNFIEKKQQKLAKSYLQTNSVQIHLIKLHVRVLLCGFSTTPQEQTVRHPPETLPFSTSVVTCVFRGTTVFVPCVGSQIGLIIVDTFPTAIVQFMTMNRSGKSWDGRWGGCVVHPGLYAGYNYCQSRHTCFGGHMDVNFEMLTWDGLQTHMWHHFQSLSRHN